ncbi:hypothetical protein DEO72_LG8g2915 [Vigna unguiculata]|uniref:Uncharacterized protein n=1 Tax=Vigna unguiculata TaxID=3917 RepID=A0A4D6MVV3_VIGUN|nr:hypothetical protein DEO72_LG8g2915 [Vigna unguiculata]
MAAVSSRFPAATMTLTVETCAHLLATTNDTSLRRRPHRRRRCRSPLLARNAPTP